MGVDVKVTQNRENEHEVYKRTPQSGRTDLNELLRRSKEQRKQDKRTELLIVSTVVLLIVAVFLIIFAL